MSDSGSVQQTQAEHVLALMRDGKDEEAAASLSRFIPQFDAMTSEKKSEIIADFQARLEFRADGQKPMLSPRAERAEEEGGEDVFARLGRSPRK